MKSTVTALALLWLASVGQSGDAPKAGTGDHPKAKEPALREELLAMEKEDQRVRAAVLKAWGEKGISPLDSKSMTDPAALNVILEGSLRMAEADRKNRARLAEIVTKHGWPGRALVGKDGAHAAWLLLQHADHDRALQKRCLGLMKAAPKDEVEPQDIAYLTDRVLVGEKKKQIYGTQLVGEHGAFKPQPIEDEAKVDQRRAEVRLRPLAAYLKGARAEYEKAAGLPVVPLWANGPPGFENRKGEKEVKNVQRSGEYNVTNVHNPSLTVFLPPREKATGAAVVIAPGGGHRELWVLHEGMNEARWLSEHGIAAFVLKYRLAREKGSPYKIAEHALQDGRRAIRLVRSRAKEWGIRPNRVGMMGFSAGGEVTALVCNHPDKGREGADDPVERQSSRPDFQALIYSGPQGIVRQTVSRDMPPTFLLVGDKDNAVTWLTSHYLALQKAGVRAELHVYANTAHGFGFRGIDARRPVTTWLQRFEDFLSAEGMLKAGQGAGSVGAGRR
jgi:endo-1,4-beta-xylanase